MNNKVTVTVNKTIQSPTTPVVELEYSVNIKSQFFGENGIFDSEDDDVKTLISILEKFSIKRSEFL